MTVPGISGRIMRVARSVGRRFALRRGFIPTPADILSHLAEVRVKLPEVI